MDTAFRNKLLLSPGRVRNHRSGPRVYRMYSPFLNQSLGILWRSSCTIIFSSCAPSEFFIYKSTSSTRFELNTNREPSGLHMGTTSKPGSKVRRFTLSRCNSYVHTSVFKLAMSVLSRATDLPFGARNTLPYTSGLPTAPASFPSRSNQSGCERANPLPVSPSSRSLETANTALLTCGWY